MIYGELVIFPITVEMRHRAVSYGPLCNLGFSGMWENQTVVNGKWLSATLKRKLQDQYIQEWSTISNTASSSINYPLIKTTFECSSYFKLGSGYSAGPGQIVLRGYSAGPGQIVHRLFSRNSYNALIGYLTGPKIFMLKYLRNFYLFSFIWWLRIDSRFFTFHSRYEWNSIARHTKMCASVIQFIPRVKCKNKNQLSILIMPPTSKKLTGHIRFGLSVRACLCACMHPCVRPFVKNRAC